MFNCTVCNKVFTANRNLTRHIKTHDGGQFSCSVCSKVYSRREYLINHTKKVHGNACNMTKHKKLTDTLNIKPIITPSNGNILTSKDIDMMIAEEDVISRKRSNENYAYSNKLKKTRMDLVNTSGFVEIGSTHKRKIVWYYAKNIENFTSYQSFLSSIQSGLIEKLKYYVNIHPIKFNLKLESTYNIPYNENSSEDRAFKTSAIAIFLNTDIENIVKDEFSSLLMEEDTYTSRGSGFSLEKIDGMLLAVYHYTPMGGSSYISLPAFILNKRAIINPQNKDEHCFKWAILTRHVTGENKHRVGENYKMQEHKYDFTGLTFPTPLSEIKLFEKNNPTVSVNIYGLKPHQHENKKKMHLVFPLKVVDNEKPDHFDLLLIKNNEKTHYTYISNFSRLVSSQKSLHDHKMFLCKRCFTSFDNLAS